jgi:transcription elongation GreA/GreB family factor
MMVKSSTTLKEYLFNQCVNYVENRLEIIQKQIFEISVSLTSETKSSAGDKHETGRAMAQLEREKLGFQLAEIQNLKKGLSKLNINNSSEKICLGSVVFTSEANYFIAISAGKIEFENQLFYAISPYTPIGKLLLGKSIGEIVLFREQKFEITQLI